MTHTHREYVVCLKSEAHAHEFWHNMENLCDDHEHVPQRAVDIANERLGSRRICHYLLSDSEAQSLQNDPRVLSVELCVAHQTHIQLGLDALQYLNYDKTQLASGARANWGLLRCTSATNNYGTGTQAGNQFPYTLDGTGVDVVITDSGIQPDHPEFEDAQGMSRVQQIDWYQATGLPGTQSANFYRDWEGHGTHVAAIVAGKTFGWAKNAHIYAIKIAGLEGAGDAGTGMSLSDCMDVIKLWHNMKPVDPITGHVRPTVVNMSWGYRTNFVNILGGSYRGNAWVGNSPRTDLGMMGVNLLFGVRVSSVDVDVEEMIADGCHVCISAGNYRQKIDTFSGLDYDNYFTRSGMGNIYYHRGSSPSAQVAIRVGSVDTQVYDAQTEYKSDFSDAGAGVDVYAPGSYVISACSMINAYEGFTAAYHADADYQQANISGTSMAVPQVAGVISLYLQLNPWATPSQVKNWLLSECKNVIYTTGDDEDYTNHRSLWGGAARMLFVPYNTHTPLMTAGTVTFANMSL